MHKKIQFIFYFLLTVGFLSAQSFKVSATDSLPLPAGTEGYFPQFLPAGHQVFFTTVNFQGISSIDLRTGEILSHTNLPGAGYHFRVTDRELIFRSSVYLNNIRYFQLHLTDLESGLDQQLIDVARTLDAPSRFGREILISRDKKLKTVHSSGFAEAAETDLVIRISNQMLELEGNNLRRTLQPLGPGNYIWPSLSPDGQKILFTLAGRGTFICDLSGKILAELGRINAPVWSPDGQWVAGMDDYDDGNRYTASEIILIRADGQQRTVLTATAQRIEMHPAWDESMQRIVFATDNGRLFILRLSYE